MNDQILTFLQICAIIAGGVGLVFGLRGHVQRLTSAIDGLKTAVQELTKNIESVEKDVRRHESRLDRLEWKQGITGGP